MLSCFELQNRKLILFGDKGNNNIVSSNSNNNNNSKVSNNNKKTNYTDDEIKDIYKNELHKNLLDILEIKANETFTHEEIAGKFKVNYDNGCESMMNVLNNKDDFNSLIDKTLLDLKKEISKLKSELDSGNNIIDFNQISNIFDIPNERLIKAVSIEANIEEILLFVKKVFDKGLIQLNEAIKIYRSMNRQSFKIKYYKDKLKNEK
jgi:hypothetical protein